MNKVEPLMYVLYSLLIGILLYIVFRFIMGYNDHMSQVSSILIASICILYFVLLYVYQKPSSGALLVLSRPYL